MAYERERGKSIASCDVGIERGSQVRKQREGMMHAFE